MPYFLSDVYEAFKTHEYSISAAPKLYSYIIHFKDGKFFATPPQRKSILKNLLMITAFYNIGLNQRINQ